MTNVRHVLIHFVLRVFLYPLKIGVESDQWHEIGYTNTDICPLYYTYF